jgi:hypothetical protein
MKEPEKKTKKVTFKENDLEDELDEMFHDSPGSPQAQTKGYTYVDEQDAEMLPEKAGMDRPVEMRGSKTRSGVNYFQDANLAYAFSAHQDTPLPRNYQEAKESAEWEQWRNAIIKELSAMKKK